MVIIAELDDQGEITFAGEFLANYANSQIFSMPF